MANFVTPDKTASRPFSPGGIYFGTVTRVDDSLKRVYVKIPRFVTNAEFGPLAVVGPELPVVGDRVGCLFMENRTDDIVVIGVVRNQSMLPTAPVVVATSTTHPDSPKVGTILYETDTEDVYVWNGTEWLTFFEVNLPATIYADLQGTAASATFASSVADNSVVLGNDTTGDYVGTITAGTGVSVSPSGTGEGSTPTIAIGQSVATTATPSFSTITSTVATGTAPLTVTSTTAVTNLNADLLDGQEGSFYTNQYTYSTTAPSSPTIGQTYYDTDDGQLLVYYGATTGWQPPWNQPWGVRARTSTTSAGSSITAVTDVSGLVLTTPTQVAGRLLKWTVQGHIQNASTADTASLALWSGTSGGSILATATAAGPSIWAYYVSYVYLETSTAAALSRRVRISRGDGTSSTVAFYADSNRPGRLICEDIGPASTTPPAS